MRMGKSILVIDTLRGCFYCPFYKCPGFCQITSKNVLKTTVNDSGVEDTCLQFPNWCPLKEIPQKKPDKAMGEWLDFNSGWNACIDEILKERD